MAGHGFGHAEGVGAAGALAAWIEHRHLHAIPLGLTIGGLVGTALAFPLVEALASHLPLMRWLVTGVIVYAAVTMLRSIAAESAVGNAAPLADAIAAARDAFAAREVVGDPRSVDAYFELTFGRDDEG